MPPPIATELLDAFFAVLQERLGAGLHTDVMTRGLYSTDASMYQIQPVGVLIPRHIEEVQAALETARQFGIPILARGGGSSLAGQTVGEALVIDFSRHLDQIIKVNPEARTVRVQPGLVLDRLNRALRREAPRLMFGPDPASGNRATLGGMLANNATGTHSILYGQVIRHVVAAHAFLADGTPAVFENLDADGWAAHCRRTGREGQLYRDLDALLDIKREVIIRDTPRHWRRNSGYRLEYLLSPEARNVAHLLCGSEGTLAIATELTLGLVERPRRTGLGVAHFRTRRAALKAVTAVLETEPSAIELFDGVAIARGRATNGFAKRMTFVEGEPGGVLLTEYYGDSHSEVAAKLDHLVRLVERLEGGYRVLQLVEPAQIENVWNVRKETLGLVMGVRGDYKPLAFIEDASVPVEHLADYIDALAEMLKETHTEAVFYAHASAGCLHVRPFINTKDAREVDKMEDLAAGSMALVAQFGGSISSEHGDGLARSWLNEHFLGAELYEVYRQVKAVFDPDGLLNPGKVVDAPTMGESLRMGPTYATLPVLSDQDFSEEGGFVQAVEMCNGNGACRKLDTGTMCPSFMVLRDEVHSTRGRANALRLALSGALPPGSLTGPRMYEVMDLCIQCKACKTECPSNVDMGKLKTEWLARYWEENPMPRRARLFAHLPLIAQRVAGRPARIVNGINNRRVVRWLFDRALGISDQRKLPKFARMSFSKWFPRQKWRTDGRPVLLFADTFNNYHHPEVSRDAARCLDRLGYRVVIPPKKLCCGRTFLSKGLVTEAQLQALNTIEVLYPFVAEGIPIVGLEPSCLLTLTDEFHTLLPGDPRVKKVAAAARMFTQFLADEADHGLLDRASWTAAPRRLLLHGHCHQKALIGTEATEQALTLPPNYTVETVDSGCCGMAGAFGYEKEHVEISMAMAERRLSHAVRATLEDTLIVAPGTSCRAQIHDTTARPALHPAQVLLAALEG